MSDDNLRGRFHSAAAKPSEPLDWPHTLERGLRRRRRRAVPAALTGVVVVAAAIAVPLAVASRTPADQVLQGTPASPTWQGTVSPTQHVPSGWRAVTYGDVQIAVPAAWQVVDTAAKDCAARGTTPAVALGTPPVGVSCPSTTSYLVLARTVPAGTTGSGATMSVDGVTVAKLAGDGAPLVHGAQVSYFLPAFGVELTMASGWASAVIATLTPSARFVVSRPGLLPYTPSQWRPVEFDGVSLRVPPTWALLARSPVLTDELSPWKSPEVNVGPSERFFGEGSSVQRMVPGVWLFASEGKLLASWGQMVGDFSVSGGTVQVFAGDPAATWVPVLVTTGGGASVELWLGVGRDGAIARDVLASIQVTGP